MHTFLAHIPAQTHDRRPRLQALVTALGLALGLLAAPITNGQELLKETFSREFTVDAGGAPEFGTAVSRELTVSVEPDPARPFGMVLSRELSLLIPTAEVPTAISGLAVSVSPTGETAVLDWSSYLEAAQRDVVRYDIYISTVPFDDLSAATKIASVGAGVFTYTVTGLPAWQDQYFAVIPVDALDQIPPSIHYSASYVLAPEVCGREYTVNAGGAPDYPKPVSRELSLLLADSAPPAAMAELSVSCSPTGETAVLDWSGYPEAVQRDIVRYDIYISTVPFDDLSTATKIASVGAGIFTYTVTGLPAWQDQYFAVIPVDGLEQIPPVVHYSASYVLASEVFSRELTLEAAGHGDSGEVVSRAIPLFLPDAAIPAPVTGAGSGFSATTSLSEFRAVDLDWSTYPEIEQHDVVRYRIYVGPSYFDSVVGMEPTAYVPAGQLAATIAGLSSRGIYYFAAVAEDALGQFDPVVRSVSAQATPGGVGDIEDFAAVSEADALSYSWSVPTDVLDFLAGFRVYFGGSTNPIDLPAEARTYRSEGLLPAHGYPCRITTVDIFGNETVGTTIPGATLLPNPSNVTATPIDSAVILAWDATQPVGLVSRYAVYTDTAPIADVTGLTPSFVTTATEASVAGLANGTTYYFAVTAINLNGGETSAVSSVEGTPVADTAGPSVTSSAPNGTIEAPLSFFLLAFSEPLKASTFGNDDVSITGPGGIVTPLSVTMTGTSEITVTFPPQTKPGDYVVTIGPAITDLSGNPMNQDGDATNGEPGGDAYSATVTIPGPNLPDLIVTDVQILGTGEIGSAAEIRWTVRNIGNTEATGAWNDSVALSWDGTTAHLFSLGTVGRTGPIPVGGTLDCSYSFTIPNNGPTGSIHPVVTANPDRLLEEIAFDNNSGLGAGGLPIPSSLSLVVAPTTISETAGGRAATGTVTRNGSRLNALPVVLTSSDTTSATVPATITIPAGQASATFAIAAVVDAVIDGDKDVAITGQANGFPAASAALRVLDATLPVLQLVAAGDAMLEGERLAFTLSRPQAGPDPLTASLRVSLPNAFTLPSTVSIPAGATSVEFEVEARQDYVVQSDRTVTFTATTANHAPGTFALTLIDDDIPIITLSLARSTVREDAGPAATTGTVRRAAATSEALTVRLASSDPANATVPHGVVIPAYTTAAMFAVGAVDNSALDGNRTVQISASVVVNGTEVATANPAELIVRDDDAPGLLLELTRDVVGEGLTPAAQGTVALPAALPTETTISLSNSLPEAAQLPATVTIPAGQIAATFGINTPVVAGEQGNRHVTIVATLAGYSDDVADLVVSDLPLPDLLPLDISVPTSAETDSYVNVAYRIENRGLAVANGPWTERIHLSNTPSMADAVLAAVQTFDGSVPVGQFYERSVPIRLPRETGEYWVLVEVNPSGSPEEILPTNNTAPSTEPITVEAAYSATVQTAIEVGLAGEPVAFTGHATRRGGVDPAPYVLVNVHLGVRGTTRVLSALTDQNGAFTLTFQPLPGEGGHYTVGAAHPGQKTAAVQDEFDLLGLLPGSDTLPVLRFAEADASSDSFTLINAGERPLTGITTEIVGAPAWLTANVTASISELEAAGEVAFAVELSGAPGGFGAGTFAIRVHTAEGVAYEVPVQYDVRQLMAHLVAEPVKLEASMLVGGQRIVPFTVRNDGGATTGPLQVLLPEASWLRLATPAIMASIAPGESATIELQLTPAATLPLTVYNGSLVLQPTSGSDLRIPFDFRAVSNGRGALEVTVVDEFYYFSPEQPKVAGATVIVRDPFTAETIATATTDAAGIAFFPDLAEGYHAIEVRAADHQPQKLNLFVDPGTTTTRQVFVTYESVRFSWSVKETEIQDHYTVTITPTFETNVPVPVVVCEPGVIDLADLRTPGQSMQVNMTFTNHGLIAAHDLRIDLPTTADHPYYRFAPLIDHIDTLGAMSSITIPVVVYRIDPSAPAPAAPAHSGAIAMAAPGVAAAAPPPPCRMRSGFYRYRYPCGPEQVSKGGPLLITNYERNTDCGTGGGPIIGGGGPGNSGAISSHDVLTALTLCGCTPPNCNQDFGCLSAELSFELPSLIGELIEQLSAKLPSWVQIGEPEISLSIEGTICMCCRDCETRWSVQGTATASFTAEVIVGRELSWSGEVDADGWASASADVGVVAGVPIELTGEASITEMRDCDGEYRACFDARAELNIFAGLAGWAHVSAEQANTGIEFTGTLDAILGVSGGAWASVHGCTDEEAVFRACVDPIVAQATITGELTAPEQDPIGFDIGPRIVLWEGVCTPEPAPAALVAPALAGASMRESEPVALAAEPPVDPSRWPVVARTPGSTYSPDNTRVLNRLIERITAQSGEGGVCARVRLQIDQSAVMTRSAFTATLVLENDRADALTAIGVDIEIADESGFPANGLFAVRTPQLSGIGTVDGSGSVPPSGRATASWTIVPTDLAAPVATTRYTVGGTLRYTVDGRSLTMPLAPIAIDVKPDAALTLEYFHQRDVFSDDPHTPEIEPSQPYTLAVLIKNSGAGAARALTITSAQPRIIDNEKGLLIDFQIIGTEMAGDAGTPAMLTPSLTANFGDIPAGGTKTARWLLTSSLQGLFTDYEATFEHLDGNGDPHLSLIKGISIHEMIRQVVDSSGRWAFLANDVVDGDDLPDTLHFSDGVSAPAPVSVVRDASSSAVPTPAAPEVSLTTVLPPGWTYLRTPDPANGSMRLVRITRPDGSEVPLSNWWVTDRTFIGFGRRPLLEDNLHLLELDGTSSYQLHYEPLADADTIAPVSQVLPLPAEGYTNIPVRWEGSDAGSAIRFDVFVSVDGGAFGKWLDGTTALGSVFVGEVGRTYAFYTCARDAAGNYEEAPTIPDATIAVTQVNVAPVLAPVADQAIAPGETLSIQLSATDANPSSVLTYRLGAETPAGIVLNPDTGELSWQTNRALGGRSYTITVEVWDDGVPSLGAFTTFEVAIAAPRPIATITWPVPPTITYGTPLDATQLNATANIPGTFTYTPAAGTVLGAGVDQVLSVHFVPTDALTYEASTSQVLLTVNKAPATITLGDLVHEFDGTPKSATATTNPVGLSVSLAYAGRTILPTRAGVYPLAATINDANYTGSANASFIIDGEAPTSSVDPLPEYVTDATFPVSWTGTDAGGVASFDVYVSVNGFPFTEWVGDTRENSARYSGKDGDVVAFYSIARDTFGHVEAAPLEADASTHIVLTRNYPAWQETHFPREGGNLATKNTRWGPNADPDADGIPNVLEYTFGLDPLVPSRTGLPVVSVETDPGTNRKHLTLTFRRHVRTTDVAVLPQTSDDLTKWQVGPNAIEVVSDTTDGDFRTIVVHDRMPLSEGSARFLRLHVTLH